MTALLALKALEQEPMAREDRPRVRGTSDERSFHHEIEHAKREPAKKAAPRQERKPRGEDPSAPAPAPESQGQPVLQVKRQIADLAEAIAFSAGVKPGAQGLEAQIAQAAATAVKQAASAATELPAQPALTPLEQAVHDLIDRVRERLEDRSAEGGHEVAQLEPAPIAPLALVPLDDRDVAPVPGAAPVREPNAEQAQPANPSHVHLVIDDGERLVVTVAVRGDNVIAHVRGGDDATASALARNAGSLEHAMRARGLQLAEFQTSRDDAQHDREAPKREREKSQPQFSLEETP